MRFIEEQALDGLDARECVLLAIVHNKVVNDYLYVLLDKDEAENSSSADICKFVQSRYDSEFDDLDFTVTYYKKVKRH